VQSGEMANSQSVRLPIGMGIDCLVNGIVESFADKVIARPWFDTDELSVGTTRKLLT
jgi:hypothetical protein